MIQLAGRDHTSPEFIITVMAEDDRSNVNLHLDIGTVPGGSNVMSRRQLGGFSTALNDVSCCQGTLSLVHVDPIAV